jgi:hypothetical protein
VFLFSHGVLFIAFHSYFMHLLFSKISLEILEVRKFLYIPKIVSHEISFYFFVSSVFFFFGCMCVKFHLAKLPSKAK